MALAATVVPAQAGTNGLTVDITPLVPNLGTVAAPNYKVSYSGTPAALDQTLHSAFTVSVKNDTNSNVNTAWLKITTTINGAPPGLPFQSGPDAPPLPNNCQLSDDKLSLLCTLDASQLVPGVSFDLVVDNPKAQSTSTPDSVLTLVSTIQAGQGNANSNPSNVVIKTSPVITFSVDAPTGLRSYVLSHQGFKVQNSGGSATTVTPPVGVPVDLQEAFSQQSCSPMYKKCLVSTLSIKKANGDLYVFGTTELPGLLQIDLLRDKSTLKPSADIYKAYLLLRYTPDGGSTSVPILACVNGAIPSGETRCVMPPNPALATDPTSGTYLDGSTGSLHFRVFAQTNGLVNW